MLVLREGVRGELNIYGYGNSAHICFHRHAPPCRVRECSGLLWLWSKQLGWLSSDRLRSWYVIHQPVSLPHNLFHYLRYQRFVYWFCHIYLRVIWSYKGAPFVFQFGAGYSRSLCPTCLCVRVVKRLRLTGCVRTCGGLCPAIGLPG